MRRHFTIPLLLSTIFLSVSAGASHHLVTFNDQIPPAAIGRQDVTIGNATFRKGQVANLVYDPAWTTLSYWTRSSYNFSPTIEIDFSTPVSNISFDMENGMIQAAGFPNDQGFGVFDDNGNAKNFRLQFLDNTGNGVNIVRGFVWPYANVHKLFIGTPATDTQGYYDFAIDNFSYDDDECGSPTAQDTTRPQCDLERVVIAIDGDTDAAGHQIFHTQNVSAQIKLNVPLGARFSIKAAMPSF